MSKVILHIEDEEADVFFLQHAMAKAGNLIPIEVASDGQKALERLQKAADPATAAQFPLPCLVLLDLKLPIVSGLQLLRWIRAEAALFVPVIILSSSENENDIASAYRLGANAYLVKPSDTDNFHPIASAIRDFWLVQNRPHPPASSSPPRTARL